MVRALNDNLASIIYNASGELTEFFYVGLAISVFSMFSGIGMMHIHRLVIEKSGSRPVENPSKKKLPKLQISNKP